MTRFQIQTLNNISAKGLERLPLDRYAVAKEFDRPDAILVRSHDMHAMPIAASVKAIARAGTGTNNIPVAEMSRRGLPVFNAPGANANAVKELVLAALLISARNLVPALRVRVRAAARRAGLRSARRGRKEAVCGNRIAVPHARNRRARRDRRAGRRHRIQARHESHRLRPGDHGRRRVAPALGRSESQLASRSC